MEKIAVIGAGAVGLFYGAKLQQSGLQLEYQTSKAGLYKNAPLKIRSCWGDFVLPIHAFTSTEKMQSADLIIVAVKSLPDVDYEKVLSPIIAEHTSILLLQNGINQEEQIAKIFPHNPILGGLAFTCINRLDNGEIDHIDYGHVKIGPYKKEYAFLAKKITEIFNQAKISTEFDINLRRLRWQKLLWNIPFNSLSVLANGANTTELIASQQTLDLTTRLMREVQLIAHAEGIVITEEQIQLMIRNTQKMKPYKTSMLLDYEAQRPMEVEAILGEPLLIAEKYKLQCTTMNTVYQLLSFLNNRRIKMSK